MLRSAAFPIAAIALGVLSWLAYVVARSIERRRARRALTPGPAFPRRWFNAILEWLNRPY